MQQTIAELKELANESLRQAWRAANQQGLTPDTDDWGNFVKKFVKMHMLSGPPYYKMHDDNCDCEINTKEE